MTVVATTQRSQGTQSMIKLEALQLIDSHLHIHLYQQGQSLVRFLAECITRYEQQHMIHIIKLYLCLKAAVTRHFR